MRARHLPLLLLVLAFAIAVGAAQGQSDPPPCPSNDGAVIDATSPVAYQRTTRIAVTATTTDAAKGTFTVTARDPARPIAHPANVPYSSLPTSGADQGTFRFHAEKGDGDARATLAWTGADSGHTCRAHVSADIRVIRGRQPKIAIQHERTRRIFFSAETPECVATRVVPWVVEVTGPGGRVSQSISDVCGRHFRRSGHNRHFALTAGAGVVTFSARRPRGIYHADYRVLVNRKVVVQGGLRVHIFKGRTIVAISIKRT